MNLDITNMTVKYKAKDVDNNPWESNEKRKESITQMLCRVRTMLSEQK